MRRRSLLTVISAVVAVIASFGPLSAAAEGSPKGYLTLAPMVSITLTNSASAISALYGGLSGLGSELSREDCTTGLANFLLVPSMDCLDSSRPIRYFLLSQNPPSSLPDPAVVVPLSVTGAESLLKGFKSKYRTVEGGGIKICVDPLDTDAIEPLYFAIAGDEALISSNVDAIRWLAFHLKSKSLPTPSGDFRESVFAAKVDGQLVGLLLELIASLDVSSLSEEATIGNILLHVRELGKFFSLLSSVDISCSASLTQWNGAIRLNPLADGTLSKKITAFTSPKNGMMKYFPPLTTTRSVDAVDAFVAALPPSNKRWLSSLADNTKILGYSIFPAMRDLDEVVRPRLTGISASAFLTDRPNARLGSLAFHEVADATSLVSDLEQYFSEEGAVGLNNRVSAHGERYVTGTKVYTCDVIPLRVAAGGGIGQTGATVSYAINLNHVEIAVKDNCLIVARGRSGLIDRWLSDDPVTTWDENVSVFSGAFPALGDDDVFLGGGTVAPVAMARGIVEFIPDMRHLIIDMPHPGDGFSWRMLRNGSSLVFDIQLSDNELLAYNMLRNMDSSAMREFMSHIVLRNFQRTSDEENRQEQLREKLKGLRDK